VAIPTITLPDFPLLTSFLGDLLHKVPFEIPTLMHPPLVHFAIALPVIIVILEVFNVFAKIISTKEEPRGKTVSALSLLMIVLLFIISLGAYATGVTDGTNGWDVLSSEAQTDLKAHKLMGAWIVLSAFVLLVFKFLSMVGTKSRIFFLLLAIAFTGLSLQQGKQGGELVYKYGTNVSKVTDVLSDLEDAKDELEELEDAQSSKTNDSSSLIKEKKELEEKVTTLNSETTTLKEEKEKLQKALDELKASSQTAIEKAKADAEVAIKEVKDNATVALQDAKDSAKAMFESMKKKATEGLEVAKEMVNEDKKDEVVEEAVEAVEVNTTEAKAVEVKVEEVTPEAEVKTEEEVVEVVETPEVNTTK
jgi:uncharacterized membrane protein